MLLQVLLLLIWRPITTSLCGHTLLGLPDISLVRYAVQLVLYKPVNADNTVAWSVVIALPANGDTRSTTLVTINEGGAYDNVSNSVIVPVTGVYYLMLTVNAPVTSPSRHRVMLNANTTALEVSRPRSTVFFDKTLALQTSLSCCHWPLMMC
jgi:hypothetical protein